MQLAKGDPATELIRVAEEGGVDLIAMSTHGHRFIADVLHRNDRRTRFATW